MGFFKKHNLASISILIADNDIEMSRVLSHALKRMGFKHIHHVKSGADAIRIMQQNVIDILITEWSMQNTDGIELTRYLRRSDQSPNRSLPLIMLTARAERQDVEAARDVGITEFVVKPYNSRTIFDRIKQVIDNPRGFVITPSYVGPDRRRRLRSDADGSDRRHIKPKPVATPNINDDYYTPKIVPPDFGIKKRIGITDSITSIITQEVLEEAQKAIDESKDESLTWIRNDIKAVDACYDRLSKKEGMDVVDQLKELLLSIKSRTGTFGFQNASDSAQIIYRFVRNDFMPGNPQHILVLLKSIQALKVLLSDSIQGKDTSTGLVLIHELQSLVAKFQQSGS